MRRGEAGRSRRWHQKPDTKGNLNPDPNRTNKQHATVSIQTNTVIYPTYRSVVHNFKGTVKVRVNVKA